MEDFVRQFIDFIQSTELSNTAEFWIQYTNYINICVKLIKAVKTNNFFCIDTALSKCVIYFSHTMAKIMQDTLLSFQFTC